MHNDLRVLVMTARLGLLLTLHRGRLGLTVPREVAPPRHTESEVRR